MASKVRRVMEAIGAAEKPRFKSSALHAVVEPETGTLRLLLESTLADPIGERAFSVPFEDAEALVKWLAPLYLDFDTPESETYSGFLSSQRLWEKANG